MEERRTFFGKDASRTGPTASSACSEYVGHENFRIIVQATADDTSLSVARVRLVRIRRSGNDGDLTFGIARQPQGSSCSRNTATNNQDFRLSHSICDVE